MNPIVIDLTTDQEAQIEPFMEKIREMAEAKKPGILVAQIFVGHMRIGIITNDEGIKITTGATLREAPEYGT